MMMECKSARQMRYRQWAEAFVIALPFAVILGSISYLMLGSLLVALVGKG